MLVPFRRTSTADKLLARVQDAIERSIASIVSRPLLDGVLVNVTLETGRDNVVEHGLGRKPRGWFVVRTTEPAAVYESMMAPTDPLRQMVLRTSVGGAFSLWVF